MIQLHCLQRRRFPRARLLQPGYTTGLNALIECHGDQPEMLLERGRALMRQDRADLALPDFQKLQQFEDRRRFRNLVEQAQMAMTART
ncbi:hypothetical protein [Paracoccus indicus]|uniref:hypothetical protein n=1 Tax=Paracoccus indicus TaxID=2079229 RepID=UPI0013B3C97F|nr:hypothetical protein [Paracoccus indicus]